MNLPRRSLSLSLVLAALLSAGAAQAQNALENIQKTKVLRVGIPADFAPYGSVGIDMKPQGLDIEMARYVADKLGVKLEMQAITTQNRIPYLQTNKLDLVIYSLGKTPEREQVIDFSSAYAPYYIAVYAAKSMSVKSPADMVGKSVATNRGTTDDLELTKVALPGTDIRRFEGNDATIGAFVAGQTQLISTGSPAAEVVKQRNPQMNLELKLPLKTSPCFIGIAKGEDALRLRINEIIAQARSSGEVDRLSKKWLGLPAGDLPI
ncbi:transporter substrate-binding domain-containing protein [Xylophilus rhododendri]|uniref:Transporter substrate-binding domain-containing protein n=1 Tax=Xylophilus rhododendri TaxID=2697032 RepID=A0A857J813_9BURK|nr:transporter substrate-binding domain-containing protein [Xylophilus rhododendri]QHJ00191.1 transporter substrate-binding domain-containing protein [Xylophilus rhododendri]